MKTELSQKQIEQLETYPKPDGVDVIIGDEAQKIIDDQKNSKPDLPPMPCGILDWTEEEQKGLIFSGDQNNYTARLQHKVGFIWQDWGVLRNNEKLIKIINTESAPDSDDFYLKQSLVLWIDRLGKILGNTPIVEELTFHLRKQ